MTVNVAIPRSGATRFTPVTRGSRNLAEACAMFTDLASTATSARRKVD